MGPTSSAHAGGIADRRPGPYVGFQRFLPWIYWLVGVLACLIAVILWFQSKPAVKESPDPTAGEASPAGRDRHVKESEVTPAVDEPLPLTIYAPMPSASEFHDKAFAVYDGASLFDAPKGKRIERLIWGDFVIKLGAVNDGWVKAWARYRQGWIRIDELQSEPVLEMYFLNVGAAAGCLIFTPQRKLVVVDTLDKDYLLRLLRWRFGDEHVIVNACVISNSDSDRYGGVSPLLSSDTVRIENIYHNGIIRYRHPNPFILHDGVKYISEIADTKERLLGILEHKRDAINKSYLDFVTTASPLVRDLKALSSVDRWIPGFGEDQPVGLQIMAPIYETGSAGEPRLRYLGSIAETINAHSIVLQIHFGSVRILLGGDLGNSAQEHFLNLLPTSSQPSLRSDIAWIRLRTKGLSDKYLRLINAVAAIVIPSLEAAPEALGAIGKNGRYSNSPILGDQSPANRAIIEPLVKKILDLQQDGAAANDSNRAEQLIRAKRELEQAIIEHCLVLLRSDGRRVILAQRQFRGLSNWRLHRLEPDADGQLRLKN